MVQNQNQTIARWLQEHLTDIQEGKIKVLAVDECHLLAGDICGRGWGNRQHRREVEMDNYRASQTYYGALDCISGEMFLSSCSTANSSSTIEFVKQIQAQNPGVRLVLVWDGASYHRSQEFRDFLAQVNQKGNWQIHCLRFAPYAPQENPIENVWGQAKQLLRQLHQRCRSFKFTKKLFELFIKHRLFTLPNLNSYDAFSTII